MILKKISIKRVLFILVILTAIFFAACFKNKDSITVKIGFVGESDMVIWKPVQEKLSKEGINLELISFADYIPNQALNDGEIDLNAFQHHAYLNDEVSNKGYDIVAIADTYISAMNIYSQKIAIPNNPSNKGRALKVLQAAGLIKLKDNAPDNPEIYDIAENSLDLDIVEVEAASIYGFLPDVACAIINCNFALDFGLNPGKDFIFQDNPRIAARTEDKDNEIYKKIVDAYHSPEVEKVYAEDFKGAYIAVW